MQRLCCSCFCFILLPKRRRKINWGNYVLTCLMSNKPCYTWHITSSITLLHNECPWGRRALMPTVSLSICRGFIWSVLLKCWSLILCFVVQNRPFFVSGSIASADSRTKWSQVSGLVPHWHCGSVNSLLVSRSPLIQTQSVVPLFGL